ncbi:hypothetical protein DL93DRAFT_2084417 [Clavulina sp. PMI_390]|nr:hypothetical protein DL93DRAFT_2084417 [Clavulina sp. PMI_390]
MSRLVSLSCHKLYKTKTGIDVSNQYALGKLKRETALEGDKKALCINSLAIKCLDKAPMKFQDTNWQKSWLYNVIDNEDGDGTVCDCQRVKYAEAVEQMEREHLDPEKVEYLNDASWAEVVVHHHLLDQSGQYDQQSVLLNHSSVDLQQTAMKRKGYSCAPQAHAPLDFHLLPRICPLRAEGSFWQPR